MFTKHSSPQQLLKRFALCSLLSTSLSACLVIPELREDADLLDQEMNGISIDAMLSCGDGDERCTDATPLLTDAGLDGGLECESDEDHCQDSFIDTRDMQIMVPEGFTNTKWIKFKSGSYLEANSNALSSLLARENQNDAWTIALHIKSGDSTETRQPIFYYGTNSVEDSHITLFWSGKTRNSGRNLKLIYGTSSNHYELHTPMDTIKGQSEWHHLMVTYNGNVPDAEGPETGNTGSRFSIFIDGAKQPLTIVNRAERSTAIALQGSLFRVGKYPVENHSLSGFKMDELSIWNSDQSMNSAEIYNNGTIRDLILLDPPPNRWWRMGDGDVYPDLVDQLGQISFTMYQMDEQSIQSSTP